MPQGSNLHQYKAYNNTNSAVYVTQFTYLVPIFVEPVTFIVLIPKPLDGWAGYFSQQLQCNLRLRHNYRSSYVRLGMAGVACNYVLYAILSGGQ